MKFEIRNIGLEFREVPSSFCNFFVEIGLKMGPVPISLYIEPGNPWENGYVESFIGKLRDELLNGEIFDTLLETKVIIENWRREYNQLRPHSYLDYRPPAPEAFKPMILTLGGAGHGYIRRTGGLWRKIRTIPFRSNGNYSDEIIHNVSRILQDELKRKKSIIK